MSAIKPIPMGFRCDRLLVIKRAGKAANGTATYHCLCDCGKTTVAHGYHLRTGRIRSCGCAVKTGIRHKKGEKAVSTIWNHAGLRNRAQQIKRCADSILECNTSTDESKALAQEIIDLSKKLHTSLGKEKVND
jgi:hypothetical protein